MPCLMDTPHAALPSRRQPAAQPDTPPAHKSACRPPLKTRSQLPMPSTQATPPRRQRQHVAAPSRARICGAIRGAKMLRRRQNTPRHIYTTPPPPVTPRQTLSPPPPRCRYVMMRHRCHHAIIQERHGAPCRRADISSAASASQRVSCRRAATADPLMVATAEPPRHDAIRYHFRRFVFHAAAAV